MSKLELFRSFNNDKLIDIVKNYRQYKYEDRLRLLAIEVLVERGISEEDLKLAGKFSNDSYDAAQDTYKAYGKFSRIAFVLYMALFAFNLVLKINSFDNATLAVISYFLLSAVYFAMLFRSFIEYSNFFKAIGKGADASGPLLYMLVGMPFYIFMYFYYRSQMKEEMQVIT